RAEKKRSRPAPACGRCAPSPQPCWRRSRAPDRPRRARAQRAALPWRDRTRAGNARARSARTAALRRSRSRRQATDYRTWEANVEPRDGAGADLSRVVGPEASGPPLLIGRAGSGRLPRARSDMEKPVETRPRRRIVWVNVMTVLSAAILIGAEVFGAAFAGGWAIGSLLDLGPTGDTILRALLFVLGMVVMAAFIRDGP